LKDMTSQLIGRFTGAVELATRHAHGSGRLTRYAGELVVPRAILCEITALKGIAAVFVMTAEVRRPVYRRQRELLAELTADLTRRAPEGLEPPFAAAWEDAADDAGRLRAVVDQVASLTDASAVAWHRRTAATTAGR